MKGHFTNTNYQLAIVEVLERVSRGELTLKSAAHILGFSHRQLKRIYKRFKTEGEKALIHRACGKASNRAIDSRTRHLILDRYQQRYPDFGPTLAAEKLAAEGLAVDHETLRGWLIDEGLWHKQRTRAAHRSWRERRAHFGELVQMDGSHHHWFEERGGECCLLNMVDDATGVTLALLAEEETTAAAMTLLWKWIDTFGIPAALYTDRKNLYVPSEKAAKRASLEGVEQLTQFSRACQKLGIRIIKAHSPQAKGRVERSNGVYQDRFVKELRLAGINSIATANELLYGGFLAQLNEKFAVEARDASDFHRGVQGLDLAAVFCLEEERAMTSDWVVRFENNYYQLKPQSSYAPAAGKVFVRKQLNGEMRFNYRGQDLDYKQLAERPTRTEQKSEVSKPKGKYVPAPDHPWRKNWR